MAGIHDSDALRIDHSQFESIGLYPEHAPPVEVADRLNTSFLHYVAVSITQRKVQAIAEADNFALSPFAAKENESPCLKEYPRCPAKSWLYT